MTYCRSTATNSPTGRASAAGLRPRRRRTLRHLGHRGRRLPTDHLGRAGSTPARREQPLPSTGRSRASPGPASTTSMDPSPSAGRHPTPGAYTTCLATSGNGAETTTTPSLTGTTAPCAAAAGLITPGACAPPSAGAAPPTPSSTDIGLRVALGPVGTTEEAQGWSYETGR